MTVNTFQGLRSLDKAALIERMGVELPGIRSQLNLSQDELGKKTGVDAAKIKAAESGKRSLKWSEFMSILFVIWNNDIGKGILDEKGLFPDELKKAMSVNRNAHAPVTKANSGSWES